MTYLVRVPFSSSVTVVLNLTAAYGGVEKIQIKLTFSQLSFDSPIGSIFILTDLKGVCPAFVDLRLVVAKTWLLYLKRDFKSEVKKVRYVVNNLALVKFYMISKRFSNTRLYCT